MEEVLFESENRLTRAEIATYLRTVAENLEGGAEITLAAGEESITVNPPEHAEFEVKVEREGPPDGPKEQSIEFELEWDEDGAEGGDGPLSIE